jgi:hypothetical protein
VQDERGEHDEKGEKRSATAKGAEYTDKNTRPDSRSIAGLTCEICIRKSQIHCQKQFGGRLAVCDRRGGPQKTVRSNVLRTAITPVVVSTGIEFAACFSGLASLTRSFPERLNFFLLFFLPV